MWGPGYTSGFRLLGLWPGVGSASVCLGSGGSVGVASCPGFVFGVRVQLWLSDLLYGTWCQGSLSVSGVECLAFKVDGLAWVLGTVWDWG